MSYIVRNDSGDEFEVDEDKVSLAEQDGFLPVVSNGKEEHRVSVADFSVAAKDGYRPKKAVSMVESGIRGAAQGASLGFADEITGGLESLFTDKTYEQSRDESRQNYNDSQTANPGTFLAGNVAGSLATVPLMPVGAATAAGRIAQAAGTGVIAGYGANENRDKILQDMALGGAVGGLAGGAVEGISAGIKSLANPLREAAKKAQIASTGATRVQAEKFKPGTAEYMLDNGFTGFGQSQEQLAEKLSNAVSGAGDEMSAIAKQASAAGDVIDQNKIVSSLDEKIKELRSTVWGQDLANELQGHVDNIYNSGQGSISPADSELIKRKLREGVNWTKPWSGEAQKIVSKEYQGATEAAISDQEMLKQFLAAKDRYGTLVGPAKASEARALQLQQSPVGGLLDVATMGAAGPAGVPAQLGAALGRRVISPRVPATIAYVFDKTSKLIKAPPEKLGKFANVFKNAAARGPGAVSITDFLLEQTDSEYRSVKQGLEDE